MNLTWCITLLGKYKKIAFLFIILAGITTITACSSGSSSTVTSADGEGNANFLTGVFLDSPVEGLHYQTGTLSGFTDEHGTFMYHEGETVTFMIGNYQLGTAPGSHIMTPIDLVPGAVDELHPTVTNMIRLLQSLDHDGNLENGITITELMHAEMTDRMIDIHKGIHEFEDYDMEALFNSLNMLGAFSNGDNRYLMTPVEAQNHFRQTLMGHMEYMNSINPSWSPAHSGIGMNEISRMNQ